MINTLINNKLLDLDELKQGLIYTTPSFGVYAETQRLTNGTPNSQAKMQDYIQMITLKPESERTKEEKIVLESQ